MDIIRNVKMKQNKANSGQFKAIPGHDSDKDLILPENSRKTRNNLFSDLRGIWDYLGLLFSMLSDSYNRKYPIPKKTVIVGIFTLLYIINPIDIIPEFIPLMGFVDDIAAFAFAISLIKDDLDKYRAWKISNDFDFIPL